MELQKTAQKGLFKQLELSGFNAPEIPSYNGYGLGEFIHFMDALFKSYEKFEDELNDNLTNRSPSLKIYLADLLDEITEIKENINSGYRKFQSLKINPKIFKEDQLSTFRHFFTFHIEM